jgi:DNA-binding MarR family transcriptional regulator
MEPLNKFHRALVCFRELIPDGTLNHLHLFLEIYNSSDPIETRDLPDRLSMTQTTINRTLHTLAQGSYLRREGLQLITISVLPEDQRQRVVTVSPKGAALGDQLKEILK